MTQDASTDRPNGAEQRRSRCCSRSSRGPSPTRSPSNSASSSPPASTSRATASPPSASWPPGWAWAGRRCERPCGSSRPRDSWSSGRGAQGTTVANLPSPSFADTPGPAARARAPSAWSNSWRSAARWRSRRRAWPPAGPPSRTCTACRSCSTGPGEVLSPDDDVAFHAAIAEATHNPLFERVIREPVDLLHDHMAAIFDAYYKEPGGGDRPAAAARGHPAGHPARATSRRPARPCASHLDYVARGLAQLVGTGRVMRLVFIDLDGTLLSGPRHISERVKRTIANVREGGVEVVLVSSRPPRAMRPFHQQLGLHDPDHRLRRRPAVERPGRRRARAHVSVAAGAGRRDRGRWAASWEPWPTSRATTSGSPTGWATWSATASSTTRCPSRTAWARIDEVIAAGRADRQGLPRPPRPGRRERPRLRS